MRKNILVPLDDSKNSKKSIKTLFSIKEMLTTPLTLLHVFDPDRLTYLGVPTDNFDLIREQAHQAAVDFLAEQKGIFLAEGIEVETLLVRGTPRKVICELADSGDFESVIIGRHADGELRNLLFGYISNYLIHSVKCPVLVI